MSLPRIIQVIACTEPCVNCWYQSLIGTSFTVMDSTRDHFIVDEYEITTRMCIPLTIKKSDCMILHR